MVSKEHSKLSSLLGDIVKEYAILRDIVLDEVFATELWNKEHVHIVHRIIDRAIADAITEYSDIQRRTLETAHREVEAAHKQVYEFFMQAPVAMVILEGPDHLFTLANPIYEKLVGRKVVGKTALEAFTKEENSQFFPLLDGVYKTGIPFLGKELPLNIFNDKGMKEEHFVNFGYHPFKNGEGETIGIMAVVYDVTEMVNTRKKLQVEQHKLEAIFQQSPAALALWKGKELIFEKVNPVYENIFPDRQLIGKPFLEALPEFVDQPFSELIRKVYETGQPFIGHEILAKHVKRPGGPTEDVYYDFAYIQIKDADGKPYGVYDHAIDVTDKVLAKKDLEESRYNFQQITNVLPQPVWTAKPDGTIDWHSERYREYTGLDPLTDYRGNDSPLHPDDIEFTERKWMHSVSTGENLDIEQRLRRRDGQYRWHVSKARPIRDNQGNIIKWVGSTTDIHDQKIAIQNLEVEQELRERFVAALSHDLRTPLTAAKMSAQLLNRKIDDHEQVRKLSNRISDNMERADNMIRDILDVSRIKAGEKVPLDIKECELNSIVAKTLEDLSTVHGDRFRFQSNEKFKGHWDCNVLRRIIENLCNNAIKYGAVSSPVTVRTGKEKELVTLEIHNEGNPIPSEEQQFIFEPYKRIDVTSQSQKGWGLGLTLVNGFVMAHGGKIEVTSSPEKGTSFIIRIPKDARN